MKDDPAGARRHGEPDGKAGAQCDWPGRDHAPRHGDDGERRPAHGGEERHVDRREEQAAVENAGDQAQHERHRAGAAADRHACERQERREAGQADRERHRMAHRQRIGEPERLHERGQHLEPRAVVPEREFDGLEMRAVGEAAGVPGERLGPVLVGIELVDRHSVVAGGGEPDRERDREDAGADRRGAERDPRRARQGERLERGRHGAASIPCQRGGGRLVPRRTQRDSAGRRNPGVRAWICSPLMRCFWECCRILLSPAVFEPEPPPARRHRVAARPTPQDPARQPCCAGTRRTRRNGCAGHSVVTAKGRDDGQDRRNEWRRYALRHQRRRHHQRARRQ